MQPPADGVAAKAYRRPMRWTIGGFTIELNPHKCGKCGARFMSRRVRDEHVHLAHQGPEPEHWKEQD